MLAGNPAYTDYELISTEILTGSQASVTFSNLGDYSATYKHLQVRYVARDSGSGAGVRNLVFTFNSDTTSYYSHYLFGDGSSVSSGAIATSTTGYPGIYYGGGVANIFGAGIIDILDAYNTSKNTTIRGFSGIGNNGVAINSSVYIDTQAVGSMTITNTGTSLATGSRFSLYGIKG
jgi:hypothetical protein